MKPESLFIDSGISYAETSCVKVKNDPQDWYSLEKERIIKLSELNVILMRQDPPFNSAYIYNTYVLEMAVREECMFRIILKASEIVMKKFMPLSFHNVVLNT